MKSRIIKNIFSLVLLCMLICVPTITSEAAEHTYEYKNNPDHYSVGISNLIPTNAEEIHFEYTVKEIYNLSTSGGVENIGFGVTEYPNHQYPWVTTGYFKFTPGGWMPMSGDGHLFVPGAKYHIVIQKTKDAFNVKATYVINGQEKQVLATTATQGNYNPSLQRVFIYQSADQQIHLTDMQCYDGSGKPLGIQVNDAAGELIHYGGVYDYSKVVGAYYCEQNDTLFQLNKGNTFDKYVNAEKKSTGVYTVYDDFRITLKENDSEISGGYYYTNFFDGEENKYLFLGEKKVQFFVDDELVDSKVLTSETGYILSEPEAPTREGYTFKGWFLGDGTEYDFKQVVDESITLYGKWNEGKAVKYRPVSAERTLGVWPCVVGICVVVLVTVVGSTIIWKKGKKEDEQEKDKEHI